MHIYTPIEGQVWYINKSETQKKLQIPSTHEYSAIYELIEVSSIEFIQNDPEQGRVSKTTTLIDEAISHHSLSTTDSNLQMTLINFK